MAKSNNSTKKPTPTINPPNSGLMAWLSQGNPEVSESASDETQLKEIATSEKVEISNPETLAESTAVPSSEPVANEATTTIEGNSKSADEDGSIKGEKGEPPVEPVATNDPAPATRKSRNKVGEGTKSSSYLETFFKKPVKADGSSLASEGKPIRVMEESHYLLSVLVSEARRQGYKLNIGDLIDNLVAQHRLEHKSEVDALVAKWKARKRFD